MRSRFWGEADKLTWSTRHGRDLQDDAQRAKLAAEILERRRLEMDDARSTWSST
jgi:hypothetical protein